MNIPELDRICRLKADASNLCDAAFDSRATIPGAINWADLECVNAEWFIDADGDYGYSVFISEADPFNDEFHEFILKGLDELGYTQDGIIRVITEW